MSAFRYQHAHQINENIKTLFYRLKMVSKMQLTYEDFIALFVPADHRDMYRAMSDLSDTGVGRRATITWNGLALSFRLNNLHHRGEDHFPPPIPRDMALQHDAPPELVERITTWTRAGGDASGDFGRVMATFKVLNEKFSKGQIRFVWPTIIALVNVNAVMADVGQELQELRAPSTPPTLPPGLLQACRKTAATVSMTTLIPSDVSEPLMGQVTLEAQDGRMQEELGLGEFRGLS